MIISSLICYKIFRHPILQAKKVGVNFVRSNSTSTQTRPPISILRQKTGLSYSLCREALKNNNNDVVSSEAWLRAYALTHGGHKAAKLSSRNAKEGFISFSVSRDQRVATFIELNCETDFVAKNQIFKDTLIKLSSSIHLPLAELETKADTDISIESLKNDETEKISLESNELMLKLGEKVSLGRASRIFTNSPEVRLFAQIHPQADFRDSPDGRTRTMLGRFGAFVCIKNLIDGRFSDSELSDDIRYLGNRLCTHVIGYNPLYIELPEKVRQQMDEMKKVSNNTEGNVQLNNVDEFIDDSKSIENDSAGLRNEPEDDWPSMMDQKLIMSEKNVRDYCEEHKVKVLHFQRFECGQDND